MTSPPNYRTVNCDFCCGGKPFTHVLHCPWAKVSSPATPQLEQLILQWRETAVSERQHGRAEMYVGIMMCADNLAAYLAEGAASPATPADLLERRLKLSEECRQNLFDALQKALAVAQSKPPATPALEQIIEAMRREARCRGGHEGAAVFFLNFYADKLADVARLPAPQVRGRWTCTGCPQVVIGCKPTWTHSFTHKHEWVLTP
jgi:hypothetical protein